MQLELLINIVLAVMGIPIFIYAVSMPTLGPVLQSPGLFPAVCSALLIASGLFNIYKLTVKKDAEVKTPEPSNAEACPAPSVEKPKHSFYAIVILMAIFLAYMYFLPIVGFIPSSIVCLWVLMSFAKKTFSIKHGVIAIVSTGVIYVLFSYAFGVMMP